MLTQKKDIMRVLSNSLDWDAILYPQGALYKDWGKRSVRNVIVVTMQAGRITLHNPQNKNHYWKTKRSVLH